MALAVGVVCLSAVAEYDETDGYVRLNYNDQPFGGSDSHTSWDQCWINPQGVPAWSDGLAPHSTTNYYIPAKMFVCMNSGTGGKIFGDGDGAKLVLAGYLKVRHLSNSEMLKLPWFRELELLSGSYFDNDWSCHGLQHTKATVFASADNPFECRAHNANNAYDGCYYFIDSEFVGGADTGVRFKTLDTATVAFNTFYLEAKTFASYPGTFTATGAKTKVAAYSGNGKGGLEFVGTAVFENGAVLQGAINKTNWTSYPTATFGSLELRTGATYVMWIEDGIAHPVLEVSNRLEIAESAKLRIDNFPAGLKAATSPDETENRIVIAHLTGQAVNNYSLPEGKFRVDSTFANAESASLFADWEWDVTDDGNGGKNVCIVRQRKVVKTIKPDDNSGDATTAFGSGDQAEYWSDGVKPTGDAAVDCLMPLGLWACATTPIDLPNATITRLSPECYIYTAMGKFRVKELNLVSPVNISSWWRFSGSSTLTFEIGKINLLGTSSVLFSNSHNEEYRLPGAITGVAPLWITDRAVKYDGNGKKYSGTTAKACVDLLGDNSGYHGRLTVENRALPLDNDNDTICFVTHLADPRAWGGAFTADADAYSAITLKNSPYVVVTNDVAFGAADRSMYVTGGVRFDVAAGKTLKLANRVTDYGPIVKLGDGTLEQAGVMDVQHDAAGDALRTNVVRVLKGALKIGSKTACDGMDVTFAEGTKLVIAEGCTDGFYNVASTQPLVINTTSGKLPVEIERAEKPEDDTEVVVCTLKAAAAEGLTTEDFAIVQTRACRVASFEKRTLDGGNVAFVATILGKKGAVLIVR